MPFVITIVQCCVIDCIIDFESQIIFGRISGLDPAGPGFVGKDFFTGTNFNDRLDKSDATFVDIYHTNQGKGTVASMAGV